MAEQRSIAQPANKSQTTNSDTIVIGQGLVLIEQASSLATPASGFGVMYCKTDGNLYYKNDSGTETLLS